MFPLACGRRAAAQILRRPSSRKLSPGVRDWLSLMPAEPEESGWSVPKPPMTKNIIGLPIVGSLCYKSVGLVKSIVWMSAIREMDAVRIVDGCSVHQAQRHLCCRSQQDCRR
ncbi:Membrane protein (modular protein) [Sinorhizobium medicae]|uniref:Membrane protein (Modular protein) n=1 Tax=Sinorhizobium medicae TaxID=110321 RepID=A0A508WQM2_9HYPH|nr:Membrane protein (modular protein) [Sinorhizobium medicae]